MSDKYVVEPDSVVFGNLDEDEAFEEDGELKYVVVHEDCSRAGWSEDDVVCRTNELKEAERIAELLSEHGLATRPTTRD